MPAPSGGADSDTDRPKPLSKLGSRIEKLAAQVTKPVTSLTKRATVK
jgi:hypothetical protein